MSGISYSVLGKRRRGVLFTTCKRPATKLHEPERQVQFVIFEKFTCAIKTKLLSRYYLYKPLIDMTGSQERQNFESMHALFVICTCVTTLQSGCVGMAPFSANQKRVIFSCTILVMLLRILICYYWYPLLKNKHNCTCQCKELLFNRV